MKSALWIFAGLLIAAGLAALVLRQTTRDAHLREVAAAAAISLISAELSLVPMALARKSDPVVLFQAAFGGTIIHLLLSLAMGAAAYSLRLVDRGTFLFVLLCFYWFSLVFVAAAMIRIVRRAARVRAAGQEASGV